MDEIMKIHCKKCRERAINEYKKDQRKKKTEKKKKEENKKKNNLTVYIDFTGGFLSFD